MNTYYGVKDQEYNSSFIEAKWLTPYEVLQKLQLKPNTHLPSYLSSYTHKNNSSPPPLIYPNELIYSYSSEDKKQQQYLVDAILIAKYSSSTTTVPTTSSNVVRLKSVLLSQLLTSPNAPILVLSLPRDTYRWAKVANVNLMPSNALRVGFDKVARQFVYIGRLKLDHFFSHNPQQHQQQHHQSYQQLALINPHSSLVFGSNQNNNLFGSLINVYEYIPAILMQLNDISSLNHNWSGPNSEQSTSMWSRLRQTATHHLPSFVVSSLSSTSSSSPNNNNNNLSPYHHHQYHHHHHQQQQQQQHSSSFYHMNNPSIDFNLTTTNYEVLCLLKQPATLKQLAAQQLIKLDDKDTQYSNTIRSLSVSMRSLILPTYLVPGQCVIKHAKMRSSNFVYELGVSAYGVLRFVKREMLSGEKQVATVEKNVESLLVIKSGVYLVFDSNLTTRRPLVLYQHQPRSSSYDSFYLEITNDGYLRVTNSNRSSIDLFNLNEYFQPAPMPPEPAVVISGGGGGEQDKQSLLKSQKMIVKQESLININVRLFLDDLRSLPVKIINIVLNVIKSFVETLFYRRNRVSRRSL